MASEVIRRRSCISNAFDQPSGKSSEFSIRLISAFFVDILDERGVDDLVQSPGFRDWPLKIAARRPTISGLEARGKDDLVSSETNQLLTLTEIEMNDVAGLYGAYIRNPMAVHVVRRPAQKTSPRKRLRASAVQHRIRCLIKPLRHGGRCTSDAATGPISCFDFLASLRLGGSKKTPFIPRGLR